MKLLKTLFSFHLIIIATHAYSNVRVTSRGCSGVVFEMPGMTENHKALILTNGHCMGFGSYMGVYPNDGEFYINYLSSNSVVIKKNGQDQGKRFPYQKVLFATMTVTDLAVIELESTYRQLRKEGYTVYAIAQEEAQSGMIIEFNSYNQKAHNVCEVEKIVPILKLGPWTWNNSIRMKTNPQCRYSYGQSGTAGIEQNSGLIYGLVQTMYDGDRPNSLGNPYEVHYKEDGSSESLTGAAFQPYATPTNILYRCYDESHAKFDFELCLAILSDPN